MLPDGWHRSTLGEIARISSGGTPDRAEPSYWGGNVPWVTTGEIQFNTISDTAEKITEAGLKNSSAKLFPPGTLLMAMYGQGKTRGQMAKLGIEAATNQACAAILLPEKQDTDFFFQYLSSQYEAIRELGNAGTQQNLSGGILKEVQVPVPPLSEQRRIARILSTWDQAIATTERLLANSRKQKLALTRHLLLAPAQQGRWPIRAIKEISERIQGRVAKGEALPVLMISSGQGFVRQDEKYSRFMAGKSVDNYIALNKGEFAYNKGNSKLYEFGCVFPLETVERGLVPHVYVCFKLKAQCHPAFYQHLFAADFLHDQLGALVNTGVRNNGLLNIRPHDFLGCKVPVPPMQEQARIASILQAATAWIERHEGVVEKLKQEKAALMAQLLTGKRRVRLDAKAMEAA
ncbi:restriction endonuclease subunit S [Polaromonas sp. C04]|uniref:restriction endonuclease subunit S n=1 Tax=Polaromonas sp. C04 TaxID=1945857 RepID=UPI0009871511|nr:restriction endonuclease subunit S [Polaromonas sp. C04]OOG51665.1 restriction endonuclease subunit S [Polaromonas sp. C04]